MRSLNTPVEQSREFDRAAQSCNDIANRPLANTPLMEQWDALLTEIVMDAGGRQKLTDLYASCINGRGFAVNDAPELTGIVQAAFAEFEQVDVRAVGAGPAWEAAVALSNRADDADRACRAEPHALVVSAADNRIADFAHDNAEALTASQQNWTRGHAQAQADAERWRSNIRHCPTPPASDGSPGVQSLCVSPGNASIRSRAARAWPATSGSTRMALTTRPSTRDSSAHTRCGRSIRFIVEQ